jgi:hypothetical protein
MASARWQPIETAPRDGTRVLLCNQNRDDYYPVIGHFIDITEVRYDIPRKPRRYWLNECAVIGHWGGDFEPTHWCPLPDAPPPDEETA